MWPPQRRSWRAVDASWCTRRSKDLESGAPRQDSNSRPLLSERGITPAATAAYAAECIPTSRARNCGVELKSEREVFTKQKAGNSRSKSRNIPLEISSGMFRHNNLYKSLSFAHSLWAKLI